MHSVANNPAGRHPDSLRWLAALTGENATIYRAIMRVFVEAKENFAFQLRLAEIVEAIRSEALIEEHEIESAIARLCEWGNLLARPDVSDVRIVEEFYRPRHVYRMTAEGEAAVRACDSFNASSSCVELQTGGLADIRELLMELRHVTTTPQVDSGRIRRKLRTLDVLFEDFSHTARSFIERLEEPSRLDPADSAQLTEFCRQWIGELEAESDRIGAIIREVEAAGSVDSPYWERFRSWFLSEPSSTSAHETLCQRTRAAMPVLLRGIASDTDRGLHRIDRSHDFRLLAGWFAAAESDADAHVLWRTAFGLAPARHLSIDQASLDDRESRHIPANTSWLDAPPLRIFETVPVRRSNWLTGGLSRIIDRSSEKEKLAAAAHEESQRLLETQRRFGSGNRIRLSELEHLEANEFELFLDLLGEAAAKVFANESMEILSHDGSLRVRLEPVTDGRKAMILTSDGMLSGPDHWIHIEPTSLHETSEARA